MMLLKLSKSHGEIGWGRLNYIWWFYEREDRSRLPHNLTIGVHANKGPRYLIQWRSRPPLNSTFRSFDIGFSTWRVG